jgi:fructan beta-fructosidase
VIGWMLMATLAAQEIVLADFEGETFGDWTAVGTAFGAGPARGTLPGQMEVTGFRGRGLINSFNGGDASTGTLTSPEFEVNRRYLSFLVGGGGHAGKTCLNLRVEGRVVRTAAGRNLGAGGSEELAPALWDVEELRGKRARLEAVDAATGGWGHVNVDHIVLTDAKPASPDRELALTRRYLHLPVRTGAPKRRMKLEVDGRIVREFEIELAHQDPQFWASVDVAAWTGRTLRMEARGASPDDLGAVTQGDDLQGSGPAYREPLRPQFHFTSRRGWLNDPNGLVYHDGEYHLFYQHNPYGWSWGNMHWGHAVSRDLVSWEELPLALTPARFGDWAFSGSAVVDAANTSGFKKGEEDVLVAAYTSTGRGECIVYSHDRGRTWQEYAGNPVVKHAGRDPRLLWHAPTSQWVMAVYDEDGKKQRIAFHTSPDLKAWTFRSFIDGFYECPDLFELPVDGQASKRRWVLHGADGKYVLGEFDGREFRPDGGKHSLWHGNFYAAQTFSNVPDGRRIQIGWAQGAAFPAMPFNQQMNVPVELALRSTADGVRMFAVPVREIERLHGRTRAWKDLAVMPDENPLSGVETDLADLRLAFRPQGVDQVVLTVRGVPIGVDLKKGELSCKGKTAPFRAVADLVMLRVLVDRGSIEVFAGDGAVALSVATILPLDVHSLALSVRGGPLTLRSMELIELKSSWK